MTITPGVDYEAVKKEYAKFLVRHKLKDKSYLQALGFVNCTKKEFSEKYNIVANTLYNWEDDCVFQESLIWPEIQNLARELLPATTEIASGKGNLKDLKSLAFPEKEPIPIGSMIANPTVNVNLPGVKENNINPFDKLKIDIIDFCARANITCFFYSNFRYILMEGGRGGGKSENVARFILWYCRNAKNTKILCGRELQNSIKESVKSLLDRIVFDYELKEFFTSTDNEIYCPLSGTSIIFKGLKNSTSNNADTLKSMDNVSLVWVEEAQTTRQITIDKLDPTIRVESVEMLDGSTRPSQLIFTYNRQLDADPVHSYFVDSNLPNVLHIYINYLMNPYCPKALYNQAETMKLTNYNKWLHIWKGDPESFFEDSLWPGDLISKMRKQVAFFRENYSRIVVACDPAQTDKEFSNEYGITVEGLTLSGEGHLISDVSGNYSPNEFAQKAIDAYWLYQADCIIVETNAGGDFIKSTILSIDPRVIVKEVRASQDKSKRSVPVANLAQMGKIYHICGGFPKLESQMARMTTRGFQGAPGESPDRLDSYNWGFIELFNLSDVQTVELIFKRSMFIKQTDYQIVMENVCYVGWDNEIFGSIICDVVKTLDTKMHFLIKDYCKDYKEKLSEYLEDLLINGFGNIDKIKEVNIPDDITGTPLINNLSQRFVGIKPIPAESYITKPIIERVIQIIPYIQNGQVWTIENLPIRKFGNIRGDLFTMELTEYNPEQNTYSRPIIAAVCNAIFLENNIII